MNSGKVFSLFLMAFSFSATAQQFEQKQLSYTAVQEIKSKTDSLLAHEFKVKNLNYPPNNILLQVFKSEALIEVWVQNEEKDTYQLFKKYPICDMSGKLGPKRKKGDQQVPEGFYTISEFNPNSRFKCSLKISYPNNSDKRFIKDADPGGMIYIHGSCTSIGCISIQSEIMSEIYWLAVTTNRNGNKTIPIYIYPTELNHFRYTLLKTLYKDQKQLISFWDNLQEGYGKFQLSKKPLQFNINNTGQYVFIN